jgi:hypothetical protein
MNYSFISVNAFTSSQTIEHPQYTDNFNTLEQADKLNLEVLPHYPESKVMALIYTNLDSNKSYFRGYYTVLDPIAGIIINNTHRGYNFYSKFIDFLTWVKVHGNRYLTERISVPNIVGVLSKRKITDWVNYRREEYNIFLNEDNKIDLKVKAFYKSIEGHSFFFWNVNGQNPLCKNGEIKKNGIEYSFSVDSSGYINQEIKVRDRSFETFLKLTK